MSFLPFNKIRGDFLQVNRKRLIHLHHLTSISRPLLRSMLEFDFSLESIYSLAPKELSYYFSIPHEQASFLHREIHDRALIELYEKNLHHTDIVTIFDKAYPSLLQHIYDPPLVLYCQGNQKLFQSKPAISVIGTRKASREGPQKLHFILAPLIHKDWTIVSGLAYGIDYHAHELTLKYGGKTIAVLGNGFNHLYPAEHEGMFTQIAEKGLVVTEYPPHVKANRHHFPERNRIISGLTEATLVIEATEKSGTNITVEHALEQGKEVYAVPGSILNANTTGCHRLIQDGAKLVMNANDILEDY